MQIQFSNPVGVVKRGAAHAGASQGDGFEFRDGGDHARAADLYDDSKQPTWRFFRWKFQRDRPAW